jgi:acyl-CoA dehydrogenase
MFRLASRIAPSFGRRFSSGRATTDGLSFSLSEDQIAIQSLARQFTANEIIPVAAEYDRTGEYPMPVLEKLHAAGLMNGHIPVEYGGAGLGVLDCAIISEELAYGCTGISTAAEANGLAVSISLEMLSYS